MNKLMTLLTGALALSSSDTAQQTALQGWVDTHLPALISKAQALLKPPFAMQELAELADEAVKAAQNLKGIFKGAQRAKAAQLILVVAAQEALPELVEPWIVPLLSGPGIEALIESAFQRVFGDAPVPASAIPVNPGGGDNALGRPATDADFGPSFRDAPLDTRPK